MSNTDWIDASTFQSQVEKLAITLTHKLEREGSAMLPRPNYITTDLGVILRQATYTFDLIYFLHSDEIRSNSGFRRGYSFAVLPLVRTLIDCLYNITALLDDPPLRGPAFRKSGYRQLYESLDKEEAIHTNERQWVEHLRSQREQLDLDLRSVKISESEARQEPLWPTLSTYIRTKKNVPPTAHQTFLRSLTFGYWAEYSSIAHATFQGLKMVAPFFLVDRTPHDERALLEQRAEHLTTQHLGRAAGLLLCIVCELQAVFRFTDANIDSRIVEAWRAMNVFREMEDLFNLRYRDLLKIKL